MASEDIHAKLRTLPAVDRVIDKLETSLPPGLAADAARRAIGAARAAVLRGESVPSFDEIAAEARRFLQAADRSLLGKVINATGVLIHTNLGRAPLGEQQLNAVTDVASSYSNLEYDLDRGGRGDRYAHASRLLTALTGAEEALVVNNNAAAVLLVLASLCRDREVVISRGELIEIGGEFRIPDVMHVSGARLVEVGTTNRTHLADYERAIGPDTAAILKVHPSNYRVVGFTSSVAPRDCARLARGRGVLFLHDLGSGLAADPEVDWAHSEPDVQSALSEGADVVTFSGDKLLGGPQAGVIVGRRDLVSKISSDPLLRAVRVDKMTLAALEATAKIYLSGNLDALPLWRMALTAPEELEARARALAERLQDMLQAIPVKLEAVATRAVSGGGSLPGTDVPSWGLAIDHGEMRADEVHRLLRTTQPPVIARIEDDRVVLDLRTVPPEEDRALGELIQSVLSA